MAIDFCQPQIEHALIKDGWIISASPKHLIAEENDYFIDLELRREIQGNSGRLNLIYVEVKCLPIGSVRSELYIALGQYTMYAEVLLNNHIDAPLYLAIPEGSYKELYDDVVHQALARIGAKIIVIDLESEVVRQWIEF